MNDKRAIAGAILDTSKKAVTTQRGQQHGDAQASFEAIGEMWLAYINAIAVRRNGLPIIGLRFTATDVAYMMGHVKEMRVLYGDEQEPDHYADHAGYVALAGSFSVPAGRAAPASGKVAGSPEQPRESIPDFLGKLYEFAGPKNTKVRLSADLVDGLPEVTDTGTLPPNTYEVHPGDAWPTEKGEWGAIARRPYREDEKVTIYLHNGEVK